MFKKKQIEETKEEVKVNLDVELKSRSDKMKDLLIKYAEYDVTGFELGYDDIPTLSLKISIKQLGAILYNGEFAEVSGYSNYFRIDAIDHKLNVRLAERK